jgi:ABC-type bacteriocin/lantibiotic exporter with double-glycine peptidase domain
VLVVLFLGGVVSAAAPLGIWLDVPFVQQEKEGCGSASIAMVMQYWSQQGETSHESSDPVKIQHILYSREGHGIYESDMRRYFRDGGFQTFAFRGEWADLQLHLGKGRPLIVALQPVGDAPLHYVVVAGVDSDPDLVLLNDPAQRKLMKRDRTTFEREWSAANRWTLLAVPQHNH